jgi:hypothetical protein
MYFSYQHLAAFTCTVPEVLFNDLLRCKRLRAFRRYFEVASVAALLMGPDGGFITGQRLFSWMAVLLRLLVR